MILALDNQDIIDSVAVFTAARDNNGVLVIDHAQDVQKVDLFFDDRHGIHGEGHIYGRRHHFNQEDVKNAVAVYLSGYYAFNADMLLIDLKYDTPTRTFSAEVVVQRPE